MARYTKENPRIAVKFINNDNEQELFEIKDRNWMNVGELFTDNIANSIIESEYKNKKLMPDEIMVIAIGVFKKVG
jgi:hypothetical protein